MAWGFPFVSQVESGRTIPAPFLTLPSDRANTPALPWREAGSATVLGWDDLDAAVALVARRIAVQVILSGFDGESLLRDWAAGDTPAGVIIEPYQQRDNGTWDLLVRSLPAFA